MWTFSRSTIESMAPFSTLTALGFLGIAIWRWSVGDSGGGIAFTVFAVFGALYSLAGWRLRARAPEDPWQPH